MFIAITQNRETGHFNWELMNGLYERVDHGTSPTKEEAEMVAENAKENYLYWLRYYKYRQV